MNSHLSSDQICRWMAGEYARDEERHLRECLACRAELEQLQNALAGFRSSLERAPVPAVSYSRVRQTLPRWILATAALLLVTGAPVYWSTRQQRLADQARADELLLERVNAGLSRSVPASMEPLMQLVSPKETE